VNETASNESKKISDDLDRLLDKVPNQEMASQIRKYGFADFFEIFRKEQDVKYEQMKRERMASVEEHCGGCKNKPKTFDETHKLYNPPCQWCNRNPYYRDCFEEEEGG
jgi:hypothetical protein